MEEPIAANIFGITSAICWSIQLLPQILLNYRRRNATGLQPSMMMFWAWAGVPLGVYNIVSHFSIALQVQPQILATLSLVTWSQVYYYEHGWTMWKCIAVVGPIGAVMGAVEFALIVALSKGEHREVRWLVTLMAVLAALFLGLGVLRHYFDIWVHRTVRGLSFTFCAIDATGDLMGILSNVFERSLNIPGMIIYGVEFVLWSGIFVAGGYYNLRMWAKENMRDWAGAFLQRSDNTHIGEHGAHQDHGVRGAGVNRDNTSSTSAFRTASHRESTRVRPRQGIDGPILLSEC